MASLSSHVWLSFSFCLSLSLFFSSITNSQLLWFSHCLFLHCQVWSFSFVVDIRSRGLRGMAVCFGRLGHHWRLKYLKSYWKKEIYIDIHCPKMMILISVILWNLFYCHHSLHLSSEISQHLIYRLPQFFFQIFMVPRWWIVLTLAIPWLVLQHHHEVNMHGVWWNISNYWMGCSQI